MSDTPVLSIGMIVKNESEHLNRCLQALEPLRQAVPCELVIADTGSDDNTREIAAQYADILFDFLWIKDFSAARNAVMERCHGAWFLSIDADEYLDPDIGELVSFLKSEERDQFTSAYYVINNYTDPLDKSQYTCFDAQRMLNMSTGLRFFGRIHESWPDESRRKNFYLGQTIFWHDGYLKFGAVADSEKGKRNLELIELEIEEDPSNLLRILQAQQSCIDQKKREYYVRRMIKLIEEGTSWENTLGAVCYRDAVHVAMLYKMPELEQWIQDAQNRYPESPYIQVDVTFIALTKALYEREYVKLLQLGVQYLESIQRLHNHKYGAGSLVVGPLLSSGKSEIESANLAMANAYIFQENWEECARILKQYLPMNLSIKNVGNWCNLAYLVWEHIDLTDSFRQIGEALYRTDLDDTLMQKRRDIITRRSLKLFTYIRIPEEQRGDGEFYPDASAYPLLVALDDQVLKPAAQIMMSTNAEEAGKAAAQVEDWSNLPPQLIEQILGYKLQIPPRFYQLGYNGLEQMAGAVAAHLQHNTTEIVLKWIKAIPEHPIFILDKVWRYDLILAALRTDNWTSVTDESFHTSLLDVFYQLSKNYLSWYYNENLLQEETIIALPSMHQFAWNYLQYKHSVLEKHWESAISYLNQMLSCAPSMKKMVSYLLKMTENQKRVATATPEIIELAEKVRFILSQYPPDDPAVLILKQSEAYQKVAYLIEGMEAPAFGGLPQ